MSTLENLRDHLRDERIAAVAAHVELHEGETVFWRVNDEGDIIISVVTNQHGIPMWVNLDVVAGGAGRGIYMLPAIGDEVLVGFDDGDMEGEGYVIGRTTGGRGAPLGLAPGKVVVVGLEVLIHNGDGVCEPTVRLSEHQALCDKLDDHRHAYVDVGTPTLTSTPTLDPTGVTPDPMPTATGTPVLKA